MKLSCQNLYVCTCGVMSGELLMLKTIIKKVYPFYSRYSSLPMWVDGTIDYENMAQKFGDRNSFCGIYLFQKFGLTTVKGFYSQCWRVLKHPTSALCEKPLLSNDSESSKYSLNNLKEGN